MKLILLLLLALCFVPALAGRVHGGDVAVIKSSGAGVYEESLEGFRQTIRHRIVAEYDMRGDLERGRKALAKLQSTVNPNLIFTLGPPALQVAAGKTNSLPVVYAMLFNPSSIIGAGRKNITGVSMNVSVKKTVEIFSELSPKIRRVGVVFNPAKTGYLVMQATLAARKQGIRLISREIRSTKTAIQAVRSLQDKIDALWVLPDENILVDEVLEYMLLFSYQNKIPVLGLSERHTQMGALLSLSYGSSKDMGSQAGEIANRIFRGSKPESIPYTAPRQVKLSVNLRAARKLKVEVPNSLLERADNAIKAPVYEDGDWWVFQVKEDQKRPWNARVTYKDGKFESDVPFFLRGGERPDNPRFLAYASVYLNDPQKKWLDFPLVPGKKWSFRYPFEVGGTFIRDKYQVAEAEVVGPVAQPIKTPAGSFNVIKIRRTDWLRRTHADLTYYYSPETKSVVKLTADKSGHSGGRHYEMELMKYGHKEPVVQAPVYEDGDWWVFRVKSAATGISILIPDGEYKVTYKDGKFESDDPNFLTRNLNLPFVAVDLNDPQTKDFEFPLIPGKKWSFHYRGEGRVTLSRRWRFVDADIVRRVPQPLETRAGKFKVIEIRRTDWGRRGARLDFTYFYSPETKSVIKLTADLISAQEEPIGHFEMELIKYGRGATLSEQPIVKAPVIE